MLKNILLLQALFSSLQRSTPVRSVDARIVKDTVSRETNALAGRLLGAVLLTVISIFCFTLAAEDLHDLLLSQENGVALSIAVYFVLALLLGAAARFIFRPGNRPTPRPITKQPEIMTTSALHQFLDGFNDGLSNRHETTGLS